MWDITFCSKKECKHLECERNQKNIPEMEYSIRHIWQGDFKECEYWEERGNKDE